MKTTATMLTGWIVVALGLMATSASAAPLPGTSEMLLAAAGLGQAERPDARLDDAKKRQMVADLLKQARQAMAGNDLDGAERLVSQAESLGVQATMFQIQGDTTKKVRRDLELKRAAKGAPAKPSQSMSPFSFGKSKVPGDDPFAGRTPTAGGAPLAAAGRVEALPPVGSATAVPSLANHEEPTAPPFGRAISRSPADDVSTVPPALAQPFPAGPAPAAAGEGNDLLRSARRALALGDTRRAAAQVQQARAQGNNYSPLGDTPDKVEAAIRKYQELTAQKNDTEAYRRAYAKMKLEQAHMLMRAGDFDDAENLANEAARQRLQFGPMEPKPEDLLTQIAAARRQGNRPLGPPPGAAGLGTASAVASDGPPDSGGRREVLELVGKARAALSAGQLNMAEHFARSAERMRLPDSAFGPNDDRPGNVLVDIRAARLRNDPSKVIPAGGTSVTLAGGPPNADRTAARAVYDPLNDSTHNIPAGNYETPSRGPRYMEIAADNAPTPARAARPAAEEPGQPAPSAGFNLFRQGEDALRAHDKDQAYKFFVQAANYMNELDPATQQRLKEVLQLLSPPLAPRGGESPNRTLADDAAAKQAVLAKQVFTELAQQESAARVMFATDPKGALKLLEEAKKKVEGAGLEPNAREQLLRRVDRAMADMQRAIDQNRPQIDLAERNNRVRGEIEREQRSKIETQDKVKLMVDEFNRLMDEQRFAEAEVVAKRAAELAPQEPVVPQMLWQAKFVRRFMSNKALQANKEDLAWKTWDNVEQSAVPFDDNNPYQHGDARRWEQLTRNRARFLAERRRHRSEREMEIERKLRTSVSLAFKDAPLSKVIDYLAKVSEVNIVLDPQGLSQEGITTDTPVTIEVRNEIMLKSALNLVLEPLHLSYVVKDEVLKVTSESLRDGQIYTVTYNVADLVVPIPNFVPNPRMGLAGAYHDAMGQVGMGGGLGGNYGGASTPLAVVASKSGTPSQAVINPAVLAQMPGGGSGPGAGSSPVGFGPGGLGGGAQADFDSIIELITSTIHPRSWDAVGGPGTVTAFPTNLSIVVSQTQETHEEIVDLLEQLRRLQDLQVTIEVRFITLNDNFFERIGVDFDFNIDDNIDARPGQGFGRIVGPPPALGLPPIRDFQNIDNSKNVTVGLTGATGDAGPSFAADLDIPYRQNSFGLAVPQFGGFDASAGATLGFAILSDIEAFFFINAASGDRRSNVLQAPKVTLFNGQQAYVSDTSQTPFVISVVPVVGDFAAAQQPVIVVLSEGTHMTVQAVVSNDRRFVRLTVVPFFSRIGDVRTFQFTGSQTTTTDTGADGWVNGLDPNNTRRNNNRNNVTQTNNGTTVQLPTFSFVTVTTTVSVPDGGTVLLGGIKRLREGRNEFGVPILSKIPYLNRLFKNTAIGRETQSLMMMVTPRIIIQEEEEENLGVPVTSSRPTTNTTRMR